MNNKEIFYDLLKRSGDWHSDRCALSWKDKQSKTGRPFLQLAATKIKGDVWPTPLASDVHHPERVAALKATGAKTMASRNNGANRPNGIMDFLDFKGLLLTPTTKEEEVDLDKFKKRMEKYPNGTTMPNLATQIKSLLPTPAAVDYKQTTLCESQRDRNTLPRYMVKNYTGTDKTAKLNPAFVAEMMGFPTDWTIKPFEICDLL